MSRIRNLGIAVATLLLVSAPLSARAESKVFKAHLTGEQAVPAKVTQANGQAHFTVSQDQSQVEFRVTVANIENVVAAHIYVGAPGENGHHHVVGRRRQLQDYDRGLGESLLEAASFELGERRAGSGDDLLVS